MMEKKLFDAAEQMSEPKGSFHAVRAKAHHGRKLSLRSRAIAVACVVLLLVGCGATTVSYGHYSGFNWVHLASIFGIFPMDSWKPDIKDAQKQAENLGITIPEAFGDSIAYQFETINTSTQGNYILSWLDHDYQTFWVSYGIEHDIEETMPDNPDGTPGGTKSYHFSTETIQLYFGSTEGNLWQTEFNYDENGVWYHDELLPETYCTIEYGGQTMQTGVLCSTSDYHIYEKVWNEEMNRYEPKLISVEPRTYYRYCITWVDKANGAVFYLTTSIREEYADDLQTGVSEEVLMEYAKQLIDLNS